MPVHPGVPTLRPGLADGLGLVAWSAGCDLPDCEQGPHAAKNGRPPLGACEHDVGDPLGAPAAVVDNLALRARRDDPTGYASGRPLMHAAMRYATRVLDALCASALPTRCRCGRPMLGDLSVGEAASRLNRAAGCLVRPDYK